MNILVLTAATRYGGGLTIYRQFISHLQNFIFNNKYYIIIDSTMDHPSIEGVTYFFDDNHSWLHRIWFDFKGIQNWISKNNFNPDLIISLQNLGVNVKCRQIIYLHQSLPFYKENWNPFIRSERKMFFYKNLYSIFISHSNRKNVHWVVQIPFMKKSFLKKYGGNKSSISVLMPDVENIIIPMEKVPSVNMDKYNFIYPAGAYLYKQHELIVRSVALLKDRNPNLVSNIRIYFTISKSEYPQLLTLINSYNLEEQFVFKGHIEHTKLLSMYKSMHGLLFPSRIESFGLPLIEAAKLGLPILAIDMDYSRDVLQHYDGAFFIKNKDYYEWSQRIENLCTELSRYNSLVSTSSSWITFFNELVYGKS